MVEIFSIDGRGIYLAQLQKFALIKALKHGHIYLSKEGYGKKGIYHLQNVNNSEKEDKCYSVPARIQIVSR